MDFGELIQQLDHTVVVFERVQANPGQAVFTRDQIFVERLMLVPKNDYTHDWHSQQVLLLEQNDEGERVSLACKRVWT